MKKLILLITVLSISVSSFCQRTVLMDGLAATATGNYQGICQGGRTTGYFIIYTSSSFNGSTTTATLEKSGDGIVWQTAKENDNTTVITFTLSAGVNKHDVNIITSGAPYWRLVYTKGNATLGIVTAIINFN